MLTSEDVTVIDGIPITTWARTMLDLAATSVPDEQLLKALDRSEERELFDLTALNAQFERNPWHPGAKRLQRVMANYAPPHTKSDLEEMHRHLIIERGLPTPEFNRIITGDTREVEADAYWPADRLVAQLDGWQFHRTRAQRATDAANDAELELVGLRVMHLIWNDFKRTPDRTARRLELLTSRSRL